jgi:transposase-like protein
MNESLLKTDKIGRLRYTSEQKKTMVDAYRASGLSAPRFAALHGVNYQTLVYWIKKDKQSPTPTIADGSLPNFFPVIHTVSEKGITPSTDEAMEVLLLDGTKIFINSSCQLDLAVTLIRQLNHSLPC